MTEAQWLACQKPEHMLIFLRGRVGDHKLLESSMLRLAPHLAVS
jgi:hypothetical protein